jgi:hypothetical protein
VNLDLMEQRHCEKIVLSRRWKNGQTNSEASGRDLFKEEKKIEASYSTREGPCAYLAKSTTTKTNERHKSTFI